MSYIKPEVVKSPRERWHLFEVVLDEKEGDCAYALGEWDGARRIGFRWNGTKEKKIGSPQSRGLPTWMILDEKLYEAVIDLLPSDKQDIAKMYLRL